MTPIFSATIKQGKLHFDNLEQFKDYLRTFPDEKRVEVTVEKVKHPRSNQQNRYLWGVCYKLIADYTGADVEEVHEGMKWKFAKKHISYSVPITHAINLNATVLETVRSTADMDTILFTEYIEKVRRWAAEELRINIPDPNEVVSDS